MITTHEQDSQQHITKAMDDLKILCHFWRYDINIHPESDPLGCKTHADGIRRYEVYFTIHVPGSNDGEQHYHFCETVDVQLWIQLRILIDHLF